MDREQFLQLLAEQIKTELHRMRTIAPEKVDDLSEPYRSAGDALVDDALALID